MDEQGQHIVLATDDGHVVLELSGVHLCAPATKHGDDAILQSVEIHGNIGGYSVKRASGSPETVTATCVNGLYHTIWIEHRHFIANLIAIVPFLQLVEIHTIFL